MLLIITDYTGKVRYMNKECCNILEVSENEVKGKNWYKLFLNSETRRVVQEQINKVIEQKQENIEKFLFAIKSKSGKICHVLWNINILYSESKFYRGITWTGYKMILPDGQINYLHQDINKFIKLIDSLPVILCTLQPDGTTLYVNDGVEKITGYNPKELIGKNWWSIFYPGDLRAHVNSLYKYFYSLREDVAEYEMELKDKKGRIRTISWSSFNVWNRDKSKILEINGIGIDITRRRSIERGLLRLNRFLHNLIESANIWIAVMDKNKKVLLWNKTAEKESGYLLKDLKTMESFQNKILSKKSQRDKFNSLIFKIFQGELSQTTLETEVISKSKDKKLILWSISPLIFEEKEIEAVVLVGVDITERRKAEMNLIRERDFISTILHTVDVLIFSLNHEGKIIRANKTVEKVLGYKLNELEGKYIGELLDKEERDDIKKILSELKTRKKILVHENHLLTRKGEKRLISFHSNVIKNKSGEIILFTGHDVTEHRKTEKRLREMQRLEAVGKLAGGVAHDFNNILTAIISSVEAILTTVSSNKPLYRNLKEIKTVAERGASLTRQLLAFSRKQITRPEILNLNTVIKEMFKMLKRIIGENIELTLNLDRNLRWIKADRSQIEEVIMNLVVNARDAMPRGGKLIIQTKNVQSLKYFDEFKLIDEKPSHRRYIMLSVTDTGVGMTEEIISHIYEPFFTTKRKGTGLGLSTVYGIVKQNKGYIAVKSAPAQGTTFYIFLPALSKKEMEKIKKKEISHKIETYKKAKAIPLKKEITILLVEDEAPVRRAIKKILQLYKFNVLEAKNPDEAIKIAQKYKNTITLLLTDVIMPGMSGSDLFNRLIHIIPDLKVLYMSGYTDNVIAHDGILKEGIPFINKPFTSEELLSKIKEVLQEK